MGHKEETNFNSMLEALSFLVKDEAEAIDGYEKVLAMQDLKPEDRVKLEKIRNAEIDHVHDLSELYRAYSNIAVVGTDSVSVGDDRSPGMVVKTDGGWIVTTDSNGWLMFNPYHKGNLRYSSTFREYATVFKTEAAANKVAKDMLRELFGVKDSSIKDYAARGSFNSVEELKGYYKGSQFLTEGDKVTVILKGGAELVYSVLGGGRVAFIRGRN